MFDIVCQGLLSNEINGFACNHWLLISWCINFFGVMQMLDVFESNPVNNMLIGSTFTLISSFSSNHDVSIMVFREVVLWKLQPAAHILLMCPGIDDTHNEIVVFRRNDE